MQPHPEAQNRRRHFLQRLQRAVIIGNTSISQMPVVLRRQPDDQFAMNNCTQHAGRARIK